MTDTGRDDGHGYEHGNKRCSSYLRLLAGISFGIFLVYSPAIISSSTSIMQTYVWPSTVVIFHELDVFTFAKKTMVHSDNKFGTLTMQVGPTNTKSTLCLPQKLCEEFNCTGRREEGVTTACKLSSLVLGRFDERLSVRLYAPLKTSIAHLKLNIDFQNFPK